MSYFAAVLRPVSKPLAFSFDFLCVIGGSLLISLMSQASIPLGFSPVPLTLQTLAVLLIGGILGSKKGALAIIAYLIEGAFGLPVFAGGSAGVAPLLGPLGGYFLGFVAAAYLIGFLLEKGWRANFFQTLLAMVFGTLVIWLIGAIWLSFYVGSKNAFYLGVVPFLIGDVVKCLLAAALIPSGWKCLSFFRAK